MKDPSIGAQIALLYELQAAWLEPRLKAKSVRWNTFQLLLAVQAAGGHASQVEISRRLGVTPATLSESIQAHVTQGLLQQVSGLTDRRVKVLKLTKKAEQIMRQVNGMIEEMEGRLTAGISAETQERLKKGLHKVAENLMKDLEVS